MTQNTVSDQAGINLLIQQFFSLFNNKITASPDLDAIYNLCLPEAIIIKKNGLEESIYDLGSFITPRQQILSDGTLTDFEEFEISHETTVFQHIAQRHSKYQKKGVSEGKEFTGSGTKFFHLLKTSQGWKISSVIWEDD